MMALLARAPMFPPDLADTDVPGGLPSVIRTTDGFPSKASCLDMTCFGRGSDVRDGIFPDFSVGFRGNWGVCGVAWELVPMLSGSPPG